MNLKEMGQFLRSVRDRQELSRAEVCKVARITTSTLQEIEAGTGNPAIGTLSRLADALGVSLTDVIRHASAPVSDDLQAVTPAVPQTVHNADSSNEGVDAPGRADAADIRLLQRIAIAILHLVGAPELPGSDRAPDCDEPPTR